MPKIDLQKRIDQLKLKGGAAFGQYKSSRKVLYQTFAESYLLWRECKDSPGFLEKEYKKARITFQKFNDNRVNFVPFVKLIFGIKNPTGADKNKASHWASVFRALDDQYCSNPSYYNTKSASKLIAFIEEQGGSTEIVRRDGDPQKDDEDDRTFKPLSKKEAAQVSAAIARRRMEQLVVETPATIAVASKFSKQVSVDGNGLVAFIGKRNAKGEIELVATTSDQAALEAVAITSMRDYADDIDQSLRTITEVIHTQTFPQLGKPKDKKLEREWRRVVETDDTRVSKSIDVYDKETKRYSKKTVKLTNPRRMLILGDRQQIVYSRMREDASVVTIMRPKLQLAGSNILFLKTEERRLFEEPIIDGSMAIQKATPTNSLQSVTGTAYDFQLKIENTATQKVRTAHFYDCKDELRRDMRKFQSTFNVDKKFSPTWSFVVGQDWFQKLRAEWLDRWFSTLGFNTRVLRSDSKVFELKIQPKSFTIRFEIDDIKYSDKHLCDIPKAKINDAKSKACLVFSMDLAPVLFNLSEISINSSITVSGNQHAVVFSYATDMGEFIVAMPTVKRDKKKFMFNKEHFSKIQ